MKTLLIIGFVWPESRSSAAGTRMLQLIQLFNNEGFIIHFASAANKTKYSDDLSRFHIYEHEILLNSDSFDSFVKNLNPDIVIYDRFMVEEQYSWRVRSQCPETLHILDTEDLHFLRYTRQKLGEKSISLTELASFPITKREIASILRSDISLIISEYEMKLLTQEFHIRSSQLFYLPFLEEVIPKKDLSPSFEQRQHFVFIGNFIHEPNWQAVQTLKEKIWPELRKKMPQAEIHIYGAYLSEKVQQLHQPKERFIIKGRAEEAVQTLSQYKVLVAPLQFGAGIKGKFLDAVKANTPYITTSIGDEGIGNPESVSDFASFATNAEALYLNEPLWKKHQVRNRQLFSSLFDRNIYERPFLNTLNKIKDSLALHRAQHFLGQILLEEKFQSRKYMSLWIQEKNKKS